MRTKASIIILALVMSIKVSGQQLSNFSQYVLNEYLINPAATELSESFTLSTSYRQQRGLNIGSASSYYMTVYKSLNAKNVSRNESLASRKKLVHTIGGLLSRDNFGLVSRNTIHMTYGIHLPLSNKWTISTAAKIGNVHLNVNDNFFVLEDNDVPFTRFLNGFDRQNFFDLGMGAKLYSDHFYFGYAMERLFRGNDISVLSEDQFEIKTNHFASFGFQLPLDQRFELKGHILQRFEDIGYSIDFNLGISYRDTIDFVVSRRKNEIMVYQGIIKISKSARFKYAFDSGNKLGGRESIPAHEIGISLAF